MKPRARRYSLVCRYCMFHKRSVQNEYRHTTFLGALVPSSFPMEKTCLLGILTSLRSDVNPFSFCKDLIYPIRRTRSGKVAGHDKLFVHEPLTHA